MLLLLLCLALAGCVSGNPGNSLFGKMFQSMSPPSPLQVARRATNPTSDPDVRMNAIAQLSEANWGGADEYLRLYRFYLHPSYPHPTVRVACLRALGIHGQVSDAVLIAKDLENPTAYVRWEAAVALGKIYNPDVVPAIVRVGREDQQTDVRIACLKALGQYPMPAVFDVLVGALRDREFGIRRQASVSLFLLTGHDFQADVQACQAWGQQNVGKLFVNQRPYVWQPYQTPPGFLDKMQFWKEHRPLKTRRAAGKEVGDEQDSQTSEQATAG